MNISISRRAQAASHIGATLLLLSSCAGRVSEDGSIGSPPTAWPEGEGIQRTLALGMSGDDVAAVHRQLTQYGYFPDDKLAHDYPAWRPIVAQRPADERTFDERTLQAVEAFQRNTGLPLTGEVDAATRSQLDARTCGTPDGIDPIDPDAKFSLGGALPKREFSWNLLSNDDVDLPLTTTVPLIEQAFQAWANETNLSFRVTRHDDPTADFNLMFVPLDSPDPNTGANGFARGFNGFASGNSVFFDLDELWVNNASPTGGATDLYTVAVHEIGHLLGLGHSAFRAVMHNSTGFGRTLTLDDRTAISVLYDTFDQVDGTAAVDVAAFPQQDGAFTLFFTTSNGLVRTNAAGGFASTALPNGAIANRIAIGAEGVPWVVDSGNRLWCRRNIVTGPWTQQPGCVRDIGLDHGNRMWGIECGGRPMRWRATLRCENTDPQPWAFGPVLPFSESGTNITVDSEGFPVVVTNTNKVLRRASLSHTGSTQWLEIIPGARAFDVAANGDGQVWVVGQDNAFWIHHEQPCITSMNGSPHCPVGIVFANDNGAPAVHGFLRMTDGLGKRITAGREGFAVVGMDDRVWRTRN